jgi:hypothetical protein
VEALRKIKSGERKIKTSTKTASASMPQPSTSKGGEPDLQPNIGINVEVPKPLRNSKIESRTTDEARLCKSEELGSGAVQPDMGNLIHDNVVHSGPDETPLTAIPNIVQVRDRNGAPPVAKFTTRERQSIVGVYSPKKCRLFLALPQEFVEGASPHFTCHTVSIPISYDRITADGAFCLQI